MPSLICVSDAKEYLQVTVTTTDTLIETYIELVEAEIAEYTDRQIALTTVTESLEYENKETDESSFVGLDIRTKVPYLFLSEVPNGDITLVESGNTVSSTDYWIKNERTLAAKRYFTTEEEKLQATYQAGYTTVTAPTALQAVAKIGVRALYESNGVAREGKSTVKSKKVKDFSVTYENNQGAYMSTDGRFKPWIMSNKTILDRYRKTNL